MDCEEYDLPEELVLNNGDVPGSYIVLSAEIDMMGRWEALPENKYICIYEGAFCLPW